MTFLCRSLLLQGRKLFDSYFQIPLPTVQNASNGHPEGDISKRKRQVAEPAIAQSSMEHPLNEPQQVGILSAPIHPGYCLLKDLIPNIDCAAVSFLSIDSKHAAAGFIRKLLFPERQSRISLT